MANENFKLTQQLAEKDRLHMQAMDNALNDFLTLRQELKQDKISFCIEQLEKVKEMFESCWDYEFDIGEVCNKGLFYEKIDKQIKAIKEKSND